MNEHVESPSNPTWKQVIALVTLACIGLIGAKGAKLIAKGLFGLGLIFTAYVWLFIFIGVPVDIERRVGAIFICCTLMMAGIGIEIFRKKE